MSMKKKNVSEQVGGRCLTPNEQFPDILCTAYETGVQLVHRSGARGNQEGPRESM